MVKGLYTSSEGMIPLMARQDQISNNLANILTTGYKKSKLLTKTFTEFLANDQRQPFVNDKITIDEVRIDFEQGAFKQTDNPLDMALEGDGFFMVETENGRRFTRNGNFSIDRSGNLVTSTGNLVIGRTKQGIEGPIQVEGKKPTILSDGTVMSGRDELGKLRIVTFAKPYPLDKQGDSLFVATRPDTPVFDANDCRVRQGFLEGSNADPIESMVEMITVFRNYEANQKAIWAQDETLGKAVNEVGRLNA